MNGWIHRVLVVGAGGLVLVTVLGLFARSFALAAMAVSFQHLWMVIGAGLGIEWGFRRRWKVAGLCVLLAGFHAAHVLPVYRAPAGNTTAIDDGEPVRIITINLKGRNNKHSAVRQLVDRRRSIMCCTAPIFAA